MSLAEWLLGPNPALAASCVAKRPSLMTEEERAALADAPVSYLASEDHRGWTMEDWDVLVAVKGAARRGRSSGSASDGKAVAPGALEGFSRYAYAAGRRAYERGEGMAAPRDIHSVGSGSLPGYGGLAAEFTTENYERGFLEAMADDIRGLRCAALKR